MNSALTVKLLRQAGAGDDSVYPELYHQVCHQFTVGAVAYLAVPHLVDIVHGIDVRRWVWPLTIVGTVAAARATYPQSDLQIPEALRAEYLAANLDAMRLTAEALGHSSWQPSDSQELLATLAALHGHTNLAMLLFLHGGVTKLSCPMCGEYIEYMESQ
ncbi:MAG: hypothetical protein JWN70_5081 [Planctomycetaceae bacterium]|nr:hypothetical protein [Planctomycetaceae bacterium]